MDTIVTWHWNFGTPSADQHLSTIRGDTVFIYSNIQKNPYEVTHTATAKWGCQVSSTQYVPVFPVKTPVPGNAQVDTFSVTDINGWYESGQYVNVDTVSSWENIIPNSNVIKEYPSGGEAWITSENKNFSATGYYNKENSSVESPAYDIRQLILPMVSLNTWINADNLFDGTSLQYAFCDSVAFGKEQWHTIGTVKDGLGWYNSNTVVSNPGGDLVGWTGDTSTNWQLSAYRLNHLLDSLNSSPIPKRLIRFRVVLGSNNDNTPGKEFDGFAFDNFYIGERNRKVLVEEFCDYKNYELGLDSDFGDPQAIRIQYHVRTHNSDDDINNQNKAEPSARALLYGIGKDLKRGVIDGIFYDNEKVLTDWGPNQFLKRSLYVSPFTIDITPVISGGKLNITSTIHKVGIENIPGPFVVQVAIVEKEVLSNGLAIPFTNVLRNMVPNSAGHRIHAKYDWSSDPTINVSWSPFVEVQSDLMVVVFIQDENTKEVYQSNYVLVPRPNPADLPVPRKGSGTSQQISFNEIALSPNPTSGDLKITFNGLLNERYTWTIIDGLGNSVKSDNLSKNVNAAIIHTSDLSSGLYYILFEGEGQRIVKKFAVIK